MATPKRVFEGKAKYCPPYMEADPCFQLTEPASTDLQWLEGLAGKRVRITIEVVEGGAADLFAPRPDLRCACCGNFGAVPGYGGPPDIPACETCITQLPATEFRARIEAWKASKK